LTSNILLARKRDMSSFKKILIAVDGSPQALEAVSYVALNLPPTDFRVNLMHVMPAAPEGLGDLAKEDFFKRKLGAKHGEWERREERAAQAFLHEARSLLLKANLKEDDVKDVPVWVVGGDVRSQKMLLAVDSSENSRKAVDYAATFAAANEAEVRLFNVVREFRLDLLDIATPRGAELEMRIVEELEGDVQRMFASYRRRLERAGVEANRISGKYTLQSLTRAGEILKQAKEGNYGTIVMGRRGLSKVHEFLLGRVTTKVLHRAADFALWIVP
jgi:nucleotide-binding universal stress UspA family protein